MQAVSWLVLVALSVTSVVSGHLWAALVLGGLKAVLVGLDFMELRHAARVHAVAFVLFLAVLLAILLSLSPWGEGRVSSKQRQTQCARTPLTRASAE